MHHCKNWQELPKHGHILLLLSERKAKQVTCIACKGPWNGKVKSKSNCCNALVGTETTKTEEVEADCDGTWFEEAVSIDSHSNSKNSVIVTQSVTQSVTLKRKQR